jgi:hypothetical protein
MDNKPNFFIIGAPKCGTTALSEYLRTHPNVFITRPKEPRYFAEDIYRPITNLRDYLALYSAVSTDHKAVGEGSATYLISKVAAKSIKEFSPNAKLIVMVRNPIKMIPSLHSQMLISFEEDVKDFEQAWQLQQKRSVGDNIPKTCRQPIFLQYAYAGRLGAQLERLFQVFDTSQIKVIVFDDFVSSTKQVYEETLSFLGVPSDGRVNFPQVKANRIYRYQKVSRFLRRPPKPVMDTYFRMKRFLNIDSPGFFQRINKLNSQKTERISISQEMKQELVETFREDILLLSHLLDRDLSHWLSV